MPVDWSFWPASRRVKQDEAIALSLGLDPHSLYCSTDGHINPEFCPDNATAVLFLKRLSLLAASDSRTNILLSEIAAWAVSIELAPIPPELAAMARKLNSSPEQFDAPTSVGTTASETAVACDTSLRTHKKGTKWTDEELHRLFDASKSMTQEQLAKFHGVKRQRISTLLTQAKDLFGTRSSIDFSVNPMARLVQFGNKK